MDNTIHMTARKKNLKLDGTRFQIKHSFFIPNEPVIVIVKSDKIIFRKPTIDFNGKVYKVGEIKSGWIRFSIQDILTPQKNLHFDLEESSEDEAVVYFSTK